MATPFTADQDIAFMQQAIALAKKAYTMDEVPVGAVVVDGQGTVIGTGYNQVESKNTQAAHAEVIAITAAGGKLNDWRLNGCWLYVTLEPCKMCMNLVLLSRLEGVAYGAGSPLFGYQLDNDLDFRLYKLGALSVEPGICAQEAASLLKDFFRIKRGEKAS